MQLRGKLDPLEGIALDALDAVVPGQALIDEREIGVQQSRQAAILLKQSLEELQRLLPHRPAQRLVEAREKIRVRSNVQRADL